MAIRRPAVESTPFSTPAIRQAIAQMEDARSKYESAVKLDGKSQFPKGENPYQNAELVIALRNELVHFKPSTQEAHGADKHDLKEKLKGKFLLNALMDNSGNPFFPGR